MRNHQRNAMTIVFIGLAIVGAPLRGSPELRRLYDASFGQRPAEELYDMQKDPFELTNLAADPNHAEVKKKMADRLTAYLTKTGDPRVLGNGVVFDNYRTWVNNKELPPVSRQKAPNGGMADRL